MKAFIITLPNSYLSSGAVNDCLLSIINTQTKLDIELFQATTPDTLDKEWNALFSNTWKEMWRPKILSNDIINEHRHNGYNTVWLERRISCFVSHYKLWLKCLELNEEILILEHDALFTRQFLYEDIKSLFVGNVISLVDPVLSTSPEIGLLYKDINSPSVVDKIISNSAYIIKPSAVHKVLKWIKKNNSVMQNDNLLSETCLIQTTYPYYTTVTQFCRSINKGLPSSVSGSVIEYMRQWNNEK